MKFFALFVGSFLISFQSHATDYEYQPAFYHEYDWGQIGKWSGITALAILGITQLDKSEIVFASAYGFTGVYYLHEKTSSDESFEYEEYVLPLGLAAMALTNLSLLQQEEESKSSIFWSNIVGSALLGTYWYYFEGPGTRASIMPWTDSESVGLALNFNY